MTPNGLKAFFDQYNDGFVMGERRIADFFAVPCLTARGGVVTLNASRAALVANFAEVFQRYRDRGAVRGRILSLDGFEAGLNSDIATVRWAYLDDAGDPLWESMFTYNLYRFPDGTKIVLQTQHDGV